MLLPLGKFLARLLERLEGPLLRSLIPVDAAREHRLDEPWIRRIDLLFEDGLFGAVPDVFGFGVGMNRGRRDDVAVLPAHVDAVPAADVLGVFDDRLVGRLVEILPAAPAGHLPEGVAQLAVAVFEGVARLLAPML